MPGQQARQLRVRDVLQGVLSLRDLPEGVQREHGHDMCAVH